MRTHHPRSLRAFTLVELLVTVGIIVLIVALVLSIVPQIRRQSMSAVCMSNQRQLNVGFVNYYGDNSGRFMGVDTGIHEWDWVQGQTNLNGNGFETENAIKKGRMYPYVGTFSVYKSPFDPFSAFQRLRTYSFNAFISTGEGPMWGGPPNWQVNTMGKIPLPSETIVTAAEYDHRGYNINGFGISVTGNGDWVDKIAPWHRGHWNFTYADGSIYSYAHVAKQEEVDYYMTLPQNDIIWPGPDYNWLSKHLAPGLFQ